MSNTYKLGSLFDGSGGFPLAGSLCGIVPAWASEVEPYPIAVTRSRFPSMKHLGDISKINGAEIEPVNIITFGSPCQDLSVAGKRAGIKHEAAGDEETTRSGLFLPAVRIIKEMRRATNGVYPNVVLWENVPGAFSSNGGEDFRTVLGELIKIVEPDAVMPPVPKAGWAYADSYTGDGWSLAYRVFDAQYWGVPQRRRRIHLVLDLRGQRARKILFEREGLRGYFEAGGTPWKGTAADAQDRSGADDRDGENGRIAFVTMGVYESHPMDSRIKELDSAAPTVSRKWHKGAADTPLVVAYGINGDVAGTLDASYYKGCGMRQGIEREVVFFAMQAIGQYTDSKVSSSMKARDYKDATDLVVECDGVDCRVRYIVRRLTPIECARLQGFADLWGVPDQKDDFTDEEYRFWMDVRNTHAAINGKVVKEYTKEQMLTWYNKLRTDSSEYKMWGNGIALPPALYCMQGIVDALNEVNV